MVEPQHSLLRAFLVRGLERFGTSRNPGGWGPKLLRDGSLYVDFDESCPTRRKFAPKWARKARIGVKLGLRARFWTKTTPIGVVHRNGYRKGTAGPPRPRNSNNSANAWAISEHLDKVSSKFEQCEADSGQRLGDPRRKLSPFPRSLLTDPQSNFSRAWQARNLEHGPLRNIARNRCRVGVSLQGLGRKSAGPMASRDGSRCGVPEPRKKRKWCDSENCAGPCVLSLARN